MNIHSHQNSTIQDIAIFVNVSQYIKTCNFCSLTFYRKYIDSFMKCFDD